MMNSPSRKAKNSSKNLLIHDNDAKNSSIINNGIPKKNKYIGSSQKTNFSKKQKVEAKDFNNENNNSNNSNLLEEENFIDEKKLNDKNEENNARISNNSDELLLSKGDFNENESEKIIIVGINNEDDNNDNKDYAIENINKKKLLDIEKYIKLPVNKINEKENTKDIIKHIDKGIDGEYQSKINNQKQNIKKTNE